MINIFNHKYLSDFPRTCEMINTVITERLRFSVSLFPTLNPFKPISASERRQVCGDILDKISAACLRNYIYELKTNAPAVLSHTNRLTKEHGRYSIDIKGSDWFYFDSILYSGGPSHALSAVRGAILMECEGHMQWDNILPYCYNPTTISNDSTCCGKAPLAYVRRHINDDNVFVIIHKTNNGFDGLTIAAQRDLLLDIFNKATKVSKLGKFARINCEATEAVLIG